MTIALLAHGTLGDVAPLVALASAMRQRGGMEPIIAAPEDFRAFVEQHDVPYVSTGVNMKALTERIWTFRPGAVLRRRGIFFGREIAELFAERRRMLATMVDHTRETIAAADLLVFTFAGRAVAAFQSATLGVPCVMATCAPLIRTATHPHIVFPQGNYGSTLNSLSHSLVERLTWNVFQKDIAYLERQQRRERIDRTTIRRIHRCQIPVMGLWSPHVDPKPWDWPETVEVLGHPYVERNEHWQPPAALEGFIAAGPPPVYVGFGSIGSRSPELLARMICSALRKIGQRGVILKGWSGLRPGETDGTVFVADEVPHDWLFPRMAAVVHHCGCGTSHAGMRAGVPTVPTPVLADQPYWANRMFRLGVAARPIPRRRLTEQSLSRAIKSVLDDQGIRQRARELGERIRAEAPAENAIRFLERLHG